MTSFLVQLIPSQEFNSHFLQVAPGQVAIVRFGSFPKNPKLRDRGRRVKLP